MTDSEPVTVVSYNRPLTRSARRDLDLDGRSVGFPPSVDPDPRVKVLTASVTEDRMVAVLTVQPGHYGQDHDTYYLLSFPRSDAGGIRCSVENTRILGWRDVHLNAVDIAANPRGPDPFTWVA